MSQNLPAARNSDGESVAVTPVALVLSDGGVAGPGEPAPALPVDSTGRAATFYSAPDGRGVVVGSNMGLLFSDGFGGAAVDTTKWDVLAGGLGANPTLDGETLQQGAIGSGQCAAMTYAVSNSQLVVQMGTTLNDELWFLSKQMFAGTEDLTAIFGLTPNSVDNSIFIGFVEVDAATGIPLSNPNLAGYFTNMGGLDAGQSGSGYSMRLQAIEDSSPVLGDTGLQTITATGKGTIQEYTIEFHAEDIIASCAAVDAVGGKQATALRLSSQVPNDARVYKLILRFRNITAAPASSATFTLDRILVVGSQELRVEVASGRGDQNAQKAVAVNPVGAAVLRAAGTNRSLTVTTTAAAAMAANASRTGWKIKNDTTTDVWINFIGTASAAAGSGNIKVAAGTYLASEPGFVSTGALSIICGSGTAAVTIMEF